MRMIFCYQQNHFTSYFIIFQVGCQQNSTYISTHSNQYWPNYVVYLVLHLWICEFGTPFETLVLHLWIWSIIPELFGLSFQKTTAVLVGADKNKTFNFRFFNEWPYTFRFYFFMALQVIWNSILLTRVFYISLTIAAKITFVFANANLLSITQHLF